MKSLTSSRYDGVDLTDHRTPQRRAVLQQVVHDQGAEDHAAGDGDQPVDALDHPGQRTALDGRGGIVDRRPCVLQCGLVHLDLLGLLGEGLDGGGGGVADLVHLLGDPLHRRHDHDSHHEEEPQHDEAGARRGADLLPERHGHGSEDDGEDGGEGQREDDLAHRAERGHDDAEGDHGPDEAPGQDPQSREPPEEPRVALGDGVFSGLGHGRFPSVWSWSISLVMARRDPGTRPGA